MDQTIAVEATAADRVRSIAFQLPGVTAIVSHSAPCFFVDGKRPICYFHDHHGGDDRVTIWCPAPPGVAEELAEADGERFFIPQASKAGVFMGWLGVVLEPEPNGGVDWGVRSSRRRFDWSLLVGWSLNSMAVDDWLCFLLCASTTSANKDFSSDVRRT